MTSNASGVDQPVAHPEAALESLRAAAAGCRNCELWKGASQTVFGSGNPKAAIVLVGEQPGDREDLSGLPFVGPAGGVLDKALDRAGISRSETYLTNVVKHFKWRPGSGGRKRIHDKPNWSEIGACLPWLERELVVLDPSLVVCLGATAAQALLGRDFRVTRSRGEVIERSGLPPALATIHPSAVLRAPTGERDASFESLVEDLRVAAAAVPS